MMKMSSFRTIPQASRAKSPDSEGGDSSKKTRKRSRFYENARTVMKLDMINIVLSSACLIVATHEFI